MKLKNLLPLLLLALGTLGFVACGDDEPTIQLSEEEPATPVGEEEPATPLSEYYETNKQVVGTYTGWMHLTSNFVNKDYTDNTFTLDVAEDGTLTVTFSNATWGTATITGVNATQPAAGQDYTLFGGEGAFVMNNPRNNSTQTFSCKLESGLLTADKTSLMAVISAEMEEGHGHMVFTFHSGEKPTE